MTALVDITYSYRPLTLLLFHGVAAGQRFSLAHLATIWRLSGTRVSAYATTAAGVRARYISPDRDSRSAAAHWSLAYSVLACLKIGMSGSASFQGERKSW